MAENDVEFNPDLQGKGQRYCCLADQIEFKALLGQETFSQHDLADLITDSNWSRILDVRHDGVIEEQMDMGFEDDEEIISLGKAQDKALEQAERVLRILAQRKNILGELYPFEIDVNSKLTLKKTNGAYLWLLSLSLLHGFQIKVDNISVTSEFEKSVTVALENLGLKAFTSGTASGEGKLRNVLKALERELPNLVATPHKVIFPKQSNDEGADSFGMFRFESDKRHGHWVFIGQSTLANSDDWSKKINEVSPSFWHDALAGRVEVVPFFATPYHAEDDNLEYYFRSERRCILDRLRLTQILEGHTPKLEDSLGIVRNLQIA